MLVMTAKLDKKRILVVILVLIAVAVALVLLAGVCVEMVLPPRLVALVLGRILN